MSDLTLPCTLPRVGNLVRPRVVVRSGFGDAVIVRDNGGYASITDMGCIPHNRVVPLSELRLDCVEDDIQALLLLHHRRLGQPIDSWFWDVPEEHRAALIRWSTLRLAAGMGAAKGCGERRPTVRAECHQNGVWVPNYSKDQPDPGAEE